MKTTRKNVLFLLLLLPLSGPLSGQDSIPPMQSVLEFLTPEEGTSLLLELDLKELQSRRRDANYLPASLTDEANHCFPLEVRTRGKFRRRRCEIPPVKLKFSKRVLQAYQLDTLNEIKLALPCAGKSGDEQLLVREYIAYRLYEQLNPGCCARARLIQLGLKDTGKKRPVKMLAMLVEHEEEISARLNCAIVHNWGVQPDQLDQYHAALMALFEYMIGNTDWEIMAARNVLLLQPSAGEKLKTVPFDFDFSGLVGAPYSSPSSTSGVATVRDRYLMAEGIDPGAMRQARQKVLESKSDLYAWCKNKYLSSQSSREMTQFLDVFFEAIEDNEEIPAKLEFPRN